MRRKNLLGSRDQRKITFSNYLELQARAISFDENEEEVPEKSWWYFKSNFQEK